MTLLLSSVELKKHHAQFLPGSTGRLVACHEGETSKDIEQFRLQFIATYPCHKRKRQVFLLSYKWQKQKPGSQAPKVPALEPASRTMQEQSQSSLLSPLHMKTTN